MQFTGRSVFGGGVLRTCVSAPLLFAEEEIDACADEEHDCPGDHIAVLPIQFGHCTEVHAPHACEKRERDEDRRDDGQPFHDGVHAQVVVRDVEVDERRERLAAFGRRKQAGLQVVVFAVEPRDEVA